MLFEDYVPTYPPEFHSEILDLIVDLETNKGLAAPRGFAKSTMLSLVFLAWIALHAKRRFPLLISDTFTQATILLEPFKDEMQSNELLKWIYGDIVGSKWSEDDLIVMGIDDTGNRVPVRIMAKGAGMKIRGLRFLNFRPDLVLIDDLENDEAVQSAERRRKLRNWLLRSVLPALAPNGVVVMLGTILHSDSLLKNIIENNEEFASWETGIFQALITDDEGEVESLWPERFATETLIAMRDDPKHPKYMGSLAFSQEMQNVPLSEDDQIIKAEWLAKRFNLTRELYAHQRQNPNIGRDELLQHYLRSKFRRIISAVDPAISEKQSADYWAMVTVGITHDGEIYVLDIVRMRESDPNVQVNVMLDQFEIWRPDKLKVEAVAYQRGLHTLLVKEGARRGIYPTAGIYIPDKDKRRRAIIHSASFSGGLVYLRSDHRLLSAFIEEILQFPKGAHDDMFDAFMSAAEDAVIKRGGRKFRNKPKGF